MAEVTEEEETRTLRVRESDPRRSEATMGILSTATGAVIILLAFTFAHGTEQLLIASIGGLLIGGSR